MVLDNQPARRGRVVLGDPVKRRAIASSLVKRSATTPAAKPVSGTDTVTIACKLPAGVVLRLFQWIEGTEPVQGGGTRPVKIADEIDRFVLKGCAVQNPNFMPTPGAGGYALTHGCQRAFWDAWVAANGDSPLLRNNLVFAASSDARATDQAKEQREVKSGLEPIDVSSEATIRARVGTKAKLRLGTMPGAGHLGQGLPRDDA
jgi:hypothetical protein